MAGEHSVVTVFDRGAAMFEAVAIAVIAIKSSDRDLNKARTVFTEIIERNNLQVPRERLAILLKHGDSLEESVQITMNREGDTGNERYRLYQLLLQSELERQERSGVYQQVVKVEAVSSIGDVQDKLREVILRYTKNQLFLPIIHNVDYIYAFSGLSESGNSSIAQAFCSHHGTTHAFRAKIVYFNDLISERLGKSVYSVPEKEQALYLFHELERFSNDHYWLRLITIESMHRFQMARRLKEWLGRKLQVIYIDTTEVKSFERALVPREEVISNDKIKRDRGVEVIRSDADLVLGNNCTFAVTISNLLQFAEGNGTKGQRCAAGTLVKEEIV